MNKPKKQGTAAETRIVKLHRTYGIPARRLAEEGVNDLGDVEIWGSWPNPNGSGCMMLIGEVKDRERLNLHDVLDLAEFKAKTYRVAVFWTKRTRPPNRMTVSRRTKIQRLVAVPEEFWIELIGGNPDNRSGE